MDQSHTEPVKRLITWRYRTAVQAARMLNSTVRDARPQHVGRARPTTRPPRPEGRHAR